MPRKPRLVHCGFCNQSFQTFEKDKEFCNDVCETRGEITDNHVPWEEKSGSEGIDPTWVTSATRCQHCGKYWGEVRKGNDKKPRKYCNEKCRISRDIYIGKQSPEKMCNECGTMFVPSSENRVNCSDSCKHSKKQKKRAIDREKKRVEDGKKPTKHKEFIGYRALNNNAEAKRLREDWSRLSRWK